MKKENIEEESLRYYIPLYIGQKIRCYIDQYRLPQIKTIVGFIDPIAVFVYSDNEGVEEGWNLSTKKPIGQEPKLLLRPLSDITPAEEAEWDKIHTTIGEMAIESALQIHWAKRLNYYRSLGIDCDNLIENGLALDITNPHNANQ